MSIKLLDERGAMKRFRKTAWNGQQTFQTPLQNLKPFVAEIIAVAGPIEAAYIVVDQVVFEPKNLGAVLTNHSLQPQLVRGLGVIGTGDEAAKLLLEAALGDWIDFIFVPTPKPFAIYADHDEYTTLYSGSKSNLNRITQALLGQGFERVADYQREL